MAITFQKDPKLASLELKQRQTKLYKAIEAKEFDGCRWDKSDASLRCPNIKSVMDAWNKIEMISRDDILLAKSLEQQKSLFTFYAEVMSELSNLGDFQSAQAIYTSLNCASIARLQKEIMRDKASKILKKHKALFDNSYKQKTLKEAQITSLEKGTVIPSMATLLAPFVDADGMTAQSNTPKDQLMELEKQRMKIREAALINFNRFKQPLLAIASSDLPDFPPSKIMTETQAYNLSLAILPRKSIANPMPCVFENIMEVNKVRAGMEYEEITALLNTETLTRAIEKFLAPVFSRLREQAKGLGVTSNIEQILGYVTKSIAERPDKQTIDEMKKILPNYLSTLSATLTEPKKVGPSGGELFTQALDELKGKIEELIQTSIMKVDILANRAPIAPAFAAKKAQEDSPQEDIEAQFSDNCVIIPAPKIKKNAMK